MYWIILLNTLYSCMSSRNWLPLDGKLMVMRLNKELMSPERQLVHLFVFSWMLEIRVLPIQKAIPRDVEVHLLFTACGSNLQYM